MADETVEIKLDADIAGFITRMKRAERAMKSFKKEQGKLVAQGGMNSYLNQMDRKMVTVKKTFDSFDKGVKMMGTGLSKFLGLAIKGTLIQMAAMGAAMVAIHASFVVGNGIMKAYAGTMKFMAGGAAAAAVALSTVAAALREQQAAMFAFSGRGASQLGSGTNQARAAMRGLATDSDLAVLGMANINKAYGAMAKSMSSTQILGSKNLMKALFDFGAAGQDPAQAAEKIGVVIEALNNTKTGFSEVQTAAKALGPQMEQAMKKLGITTKKAFQEALLSGELAKEGGVLGQFAAVNNTLISRVKAFFNLIKEEFADFGQQFLEPAKTAMTKIMRIIKRDLMRVGAELEAFGTGSFFDGLVNAVDKVSNFFVKLIREYLPGAQGIFGRIFDFFDRFGRGWDVLTDKLRPFIEGARVIESIFSPIWKTIKEEGTKSFNSFNSQLVNNSESVAEFGERIAGLLKSALEIGRVFRQMFFESLPFINDVLSGITQIVDMLRGMVSGFGNMFGSTGGLMAFAIMARQMKSTSGGLLGTVKGNMTLTPNTVIINAPGAPPMTLTPGGTPNMYGGAGRAPGGAGVQPPGGRSGVSSGAQSAQSAQVAAALYSRGIVPGQQPTGQTVQTRQAAKKGFIFGLGSGKKMYQTPEGAYYSTTTGRLLKRGPSIGSRMREARGRSFGTALFGNGKDVSGINNSMGARMGVGMGLSMASQYAPEEMRGAMALGGMVGSFNPVLGLGIAGVGGAMQARSALGGALAGGVGGAALGSQIAGGPGAIVGAVIGTLGGAIMGAVNKFKKQAEEARNAMASSINGITKTVFTQAYGQFQEAQKAIAEGRSTAGMGGSFTGLAKNFRKRTSVIKGMIGYGAAPLRDKKYYEIMNANLNERYGRQTDNDFYNSQILEGADLAKMQDLARLSAKQKQDPKMRNRLELSNVIIDQARSNYAKVAQYIFDNQKELGTVVSEEDLKKQLKNPGEAAKKADKLISAQERAYAKLDQVNNGRLKSLAQMSGKTIPEVEKLAHSLGVNVYDATKKFSDIVTELGLNMVRTSAEMRQANTDVLVNSISILDAEIKAAEAVSLRNEETEAFRVAASGGKLNKQEILDYVAKMQPLILAANKGDELASYFEFESQFGNAENPGKLFTSKNGALKNIDPSTIFTPETTPILQEFNKARREGLITNAADQLNRQLVATGVSGDVSQISAGINTLNQDQLKTFLYGVRNGNIDIGASANRAGFNALKGTGPTSAREVISQAVGFDIGEIKAPPKTVDDIVNNMDKFSSEFKTAVDQFVKDTDAVFKSFGDKPEWMTQDFINLVAKTNSGKRDTSSPRFGRVGDTTSSRLSQTMARHSAIDGMLTGNRSITSSYRTYALGSPSSDHVTGRAIDLVGANLGQYKQLTEKAGGFAEFHGRGGSRHLHVVPGPGFSGIGDTASPMSSQQPIIVSSGANGSNNYYTFNINGSNMSPEEVANQVMAKIRDQQRAERER